MGTTFSLFPNLIWIFNDHPFVNQDFLCGLTQAEQCSPLLFAVVTLVCRVILLKKDWQDSLTLVIS